MLHGLLLADHPDNLKCILRYQDYRRYHSYGCDLRPVRLRKRNSCCKREQRPSLVNSNANDKVNVNEYYKPVRRCGRNDNN